MSDFDAKKFEAELLNNLKSRKFDVGLAKTYSATITKFRTSGYILDRIWKFGQAPNFDGIGIAGRFGLGDLVKLTELVKSPDFRGVEIFPIGIINPEGFGFTAKFGGAEQFGPGK